MKHCITIILFITSMSLWSQYSQNQALDIAGVYIKNGFGIKTNFNKNIGLKGIFHIGGQLNLEKFSENLPESIEVNTLLMNAEYYYKILDINQSDIIVSIGLGGVVGYEIIGNNKILDNGSQIIGENSIIYGGHGGIELDKFLFSIGPSGNSLSLFIQGREYLILNSNLGKNQFNASAGLRYNF